MEINRILKKIPLRGSFENVLFWDVLFFCFLAAIASTVFTAIEGLGALAITYTAMSFAINTFIVPPMFFICGAFDSGTPFTTLLSQEQWTKPDYGKEIKYDSRNCPSRIG